MVNREAALQALYERIKEDRFSIGLSSFYRSPGVPIDVNKLPTLTMIEGLDTVVKMNSRGVSIYPARRALEIVLELTTADDADVKLMLRKVRNSALGTTPVLADDSFIAETRIEGPAGYDIPNIQGMRLVFTLLYTDSGA